MMLPVPRLPLLRLLLRFRVERSIEMPPFRGSMWKGALGEQLAHGRWQSSDGRNLYRLLLAPAAEDCLLLRPERPPPLVLSMPSQLIPHPKGGWQAVATYAEPGQDLLLSLTLVGQAAHEAETVVHVFATAAAQGIGTNDDQGNRGCAVLNSIQHLTDHADARPIPLEALSELQAATPAIPPLQMPNIAFTLLQPLLLETSNSSNTKARKVRVEPEDLEAFRLASAIVRRISNLAAVHGGFDVPLEGLHSKLEGLHFRRADFTLATQGRYSASQEDRVTGSGIVGHCELDISEHEWLWPYLVLAQYVHVGKGAVMGMGALRLLPAGP